MIRSSVLAGAMLTLVAAFPAFAAPARSSGIQRTQEVAVNDVPRCTRKFGKVSVMDGDDPSGWTQFQLTGPQKLIKVLVQRSGCFNLVDRGSGLSAAQRERDIGSKKMEAYAVLSLTNVRTSETIAVQDGYAVKKSLSFGGGGGMGFFGGASGAVGGGYDNTDIGRIVTPPFIQAY